MFLNPTRTSCQGDRFLSKQERTKNGLKNTLTNNTILSEEMRSVRQRICDPTPVAFAKFRNRITNVFVFSANGPQDRPTMNARPRDKWTAICTRVSFRFYRQQSVRLQKFGYDLNISLRAVRKSRQRIIYLSVTFDRVPKLTRWKTNKRWTGLRTSKRRVW